MTKNKPWGSWGIYKPTFTRESLKCAAEICKSWGIGGNYKLTFIWREKEPILYTI